MNKHTEGPWSFGYYGCNGYCIMGGNGQHIATSILYKKDGGEANARLIAAAPEMFEEIEQEYTELADHRNNWTGRHTPEGQARLIRLRDIIVKVTGRDPQDVQDDYGCRLAKADAIAKARG